MCYYVLYMSYVVKHKYPKRKHPGLLTGMH